MGFLQAIRGSIYDPVYYRKLVERPLGTSLLYFVLLSLLLSVLITPIFAIMFIPKALTVVGQINPTVLEFYPDELVINIEDGQVSTNVREPYFWPVPEQAFPDIQTEDEDHILVIDTTTPFSTTQFDEYNSVAWLTREEIIVRRDDRETLEVIPLSDIPNVTIDEEFVSSQVSNFLDTFTPIIRGLIWFSPVLMLAGFFLLFSFRMVYLLLGALVVLLIARIKGLEIGYQKSFQLGLHLMTPGLLVSAFSLALGSRLGLDWGVPFFFTGVLAVTTWINLKPEVPGSEEIPFEHIEPDRQDGEGF